MCFGGGWRERVLVDMLANPLKRSPPPLQVDLCSIVTTIYCVVCLVAYRELLHEMLSRLEMSKAEMSKVENEQRLFLNFNSMFDKMKIVTKHFLTSFRVTDLTLNWLFKAELIARKKNDVNDSLNQTRVCSISRLKYCPFNHTFQT